jgi:hypothetical protein
MKALHIVVCIGAVGLAQANTCPVPGTTAQWVTAWCMLETGDLNPVSASVRECIARRAEIDQPCELNAAFKMQYCVLLVEKARYAGSVEACVADAGVLPAPVSSGGEHAE